MGLVPVRDSIVRGYTFLFARFFTVLGLGWLPAAFYGVASAWLIRAVSTGALGAPPASGAFNQYSLGYLVAMLIVTAFFGAPMLIPFTREALGMHEEPVAAHFSYGPREWRLFVALLRFYGIVGGALFVLIVASGIGISQFANSPIVWLGVPLVSWLNSLSAVIVLSTAAFLAVRLGFFLGPIAAVEGHAKLSRAWVLSRQNFWRLLVVFLAVAIPAVLVVLIAEYALWGSELDAATRTTGSNALAIFKLQYDHSVSIAAMMATALMAVNALFGAASASAYVAQDAEVPDTTAAVPAQESNWGIHRAPAYADAGVVQRLEAAAPVVVERPMTMEVRYPDPVIEAALMPVEEAPAHVPVVEAVAHPPEPIAVEAPDVVEAAVPEVHIPSELPVEPVHSAEPEVHAEPEVPVEAAVEHTDHTDHADHAEAPVAMAAPSLDPAGLAHAAKEHEAA